MSQKTYVPGVFAKCKTNPFWVLQLSCNAEQLVNFIKANTDEQGKIRFDICEKRNPDEKTTHTVSLNTWQPDSRSAQQYKQPSTKPADGVPF